MEETRNENYERGRSRSIEGHIQVTSEGMTEVSSSSRPRSGSKVSTNETELGVISV